VKTIALVPRLACAAVLASLAAACSDGGGITQPTPGTPAPQPPLASIACSASVKDGRVQCADAASGARADRVIGGQRVNVLVQTSNVLYDSLLPTVASPVSRRDFPRANALLGYEPAEPAETLPTGDVVEINPCAGSLSSGVTKR